MLFNQTIKNLNRLRQIIQVLVKYGFEDMVTNTTLKNLVPRSRQLSWSRQNRPVFAYSRYERIRMVLEELGPTYIKFAQVLSNRPDLLPEALIREFEKLQSDVPPVPFAVVRQSIERELGQPIDALFEYLLEKPLGSASIGQVHRARLKTGEEVIVKVQRPRVRFTVETDISILKEVALRAEGYLERQGIPAVMDILETLEKTMQRELDYRNEVRNIRQFGHVYRKHKDFNVPKAFPEYCTGRVLVQAYAAGCRITDVAQMQAWNLKPEDIAARGLRGYLEQMFDVGFFHADPHPGNLILQEDGSITLIDFGMVGRLGRSDKLALAGIFTAMAQEDPRQMAMQLMRLATDHQIDDRSKLERDLASLIDDFSGLELQEGNIGELGIRLQAIIFQYRLQVPGSIFLILRALAILEGIGKQLHPTLNAYAEIKPFGLKLFREQYTPSNLAGELSWRFATIDQLLRNLPQELNDILRQLRKGELRVESHSADHEAQMRQLAAQGDRLVYTLLAGFLLVASAIGLVAQDDATTTLWGMPLFSLVCWALAGLLAFMLFIRRAR